MFRVALRKESVDRNKYVVQCRKVLGVALRKESVDRNITPKSVIPGPRWSLSARRAWIEIMGYWQGTPHYSVALRKESVDRNSGNNQYICKAGGRSPQGERG